MVADGDDHGALHDVAQLADVPGPRITLQCIHARSRNGIDALAEGFRELVDEAPDELGNVVGALAQRWQLNRKDVQTVVEVLPERIAGNALFEVAVGRGDDSHVQRQRPGAAEPLDLPLLEHAQQLDLHVGRQVADLVEKNRRVIRQLETTDLSSPARR